MGSINKKINRKLESSPIAILHSNIVKENAKGSYVVTTNDFTNDAKDFAKDFDNIIPLINKIAILPIKSIRS